MNKYIYKYLLLLLTIALTVLLWDKGIVLFLLLSVVALILLSLDEYRLVKEFFAIAIFGTVTEIIIISLSDAWRYNTDTLLKVPIWLFPLWGIAGVMAVSIYFFFNNKNSNKKLKM